jgi:hypothetical protein
LSQVPEQRVNPRDPRPVDPVCDPRDPRPVNPLEVRGISAPVILRRAIRSVFRDPRSPIGDATTTIVIAVALFRARARADKKIACRFLTFRALYA